MSERRGEVVAISPATTVDVAARQGSSALEERLDRVRLATARPWSQQARRIGFVWFRVFVWERGASGKQERVNVRIPIPLPGLGALMPRRLSWQQASHAIEVARTSDADETAAYLDSVMGFEIVRVEEERRSGSKQLVVVGLD